MKSLDTFYGGFLAPSIFMNIIYFSKSLLATVEHCLDLQFKPNNSGISLIEQKLQCIKFLPITIN